MPTDSNTYIILSAMITPAIFLTVVSSLILSTSNRISRVNDRTHLLNDMHDTLSRNPGDLDFPELRIEFVEWQLCTLIRRGNQIRYCLILQYISFVLFVATSLVLALDVWMGYVMTIMPTATAVAGVVLMLGSGLNLVREAWAAIAYNQREIQFYDELHARRRATARDSLESKAHP